MSDAGEPVDSKPALDLVVGGRHMTCCEYSRQRGEELVASARLARAIRERLQPDEVADLLLDIMRRGSKRDRKSALTAATMLLERLQPRRELRRLLAVEVMLARRELEAPK